MELNLQTAELALREASESNPGAWADHSRFVAEACKNIASHCKDLSRVLWKTVFVRRDIVYYESNDFLETADRQGKVAA